MCQSDLPLKVGWAGSTLFARDVGPRERCGKEGHARGSRNATFEPSENERTVEINCWLGADVFDPPTPFAAQMIVAQAIGFGINDALETCLQSRPLRRVDLDLEQGELHALTEVTTSLGDTA